MSALESLATEHGEGARAAAETWLEELVVLTFRENRRGGDPIAHTADGRAVFPDKYRDGDRVLPGESWLCTVAKKGDNTFFAAPLARVDEDFFRGLVPVERRRMAEALWAEHRDVVLDELRELLMEEDGSSLLATSARSDEEVSSIRREREELRERLSELSELYDEAVTRLAEARALPHGKNEGEDLPEGEKEPRGPFVVRRPAADVLECSAFEETGWHGHVSPNGRVVFLKAHARGPIACTGGRLVLPGLSRYLDASVDTLEARFDPRHGGFFIRLP